MPEPGPIPAGKGSQRTAGDPKALIPAIRSLLERHDKNLPITNVYTQAEYIDMMYTIHHAADSIVSG